MEEAIEAYRKVSLIKPNYAPAYNNMGSALQSFGKLEDALDAYAKALAIKPDYDHAYFNMGITLKSTIFTKPNKTLQHTISSFCKKKYVRPIYIVRAVIKFKI